jgi:hypothetical protein
LRRKVATLFRGLRREKVAPAGQLRREELVVIENADLGGFLLLKSFLESVDDVDNAVFDQRDVEIDAQPQTFIGQLQIGEERLLCTGARPIPANPAQG